MSNKFTEEEYKEIVYMFSVAGDAEEEARLVAEYVSSIKHSSDYYKALALANPVTRELAYDKFVEEEKTYFWTNKNKKRFGLYKYDGVVSPKIGMLTELTESEIKAWGYNPEMFDREEV